MGADSTGHHFLEFYPNDPAGITRALCDFNRSRAGVTRRFYRAEQISQLGYVFVHQEERWRHVYKAPFRSPAIVANSSCRQPAMAFSMVGAR
jgi:hypothetical protein